MRVDKFLWCMRYFKTRSLATSIVNKNRVQVNGQVVKPSKEVMPGDRLRVIKDQIHYECQILQIPKSRIGAKLVPLHINDLTPIEELNKRELRNLSQNYYREKGEGRPTKKDRRNLDDYLNENFLFEDFED
ncbi:MAG: RNA-binding S4 domain-containing protein [Flavobacteriales bacterium]